MSAPAEATEPTRPAKLYKYGAFTPQGLENLKNQVIYFSSPANFNDPYDCALHPEIKLLTDEMAEQVRQHNLARKDIPEHIQHEYANYSSIAFLDMLMRSGRAALNESLEIQRKRIGISCFSEKNDNLLMWSHYADHHKGFCLEFNTDGEVFQKARPVIYVEKMPEFDTLPLLLNVPAGVADLFCIKSSDWQYEKEWRVIHAQGATSYHYGANELAGIYFGLKASFTMIEIAALILAGQNQSVQLWKAKKSNANFSVEFERFTYTSHVAATRLGLI